jgi:UPF0042 nucleotide-binding protein
MGSSPTKIQNDIWFISGISGAGRATALHALEDADCHVIDNLPIQLAKRLLKSKQGDGDDDIDGRPVVIGMDSRTQGFSSHALLDLIHAFQDHPLYHLKLIFLDCQDDILLRRFNSTRRHHPLTNKEQGLIDAITRERELLADLRQCADLVIDTTSMKPSDLQAMVKTYLNIDAEHGMTISIMSFAYKNGLPREADFVFDMRFLDNPFYNESLRHQTGKDQAVKDFIDHDSTLSGFLDHLKAMLKLIIPRYQKDGKKFLTIAFGCTGGQHRSVFAAEYFAKWFRDTEWQPLLKHRELPH